MLSIPTALPQTVIKLSFKKKIKVILLMSDRQAYSSKESSLQNELINQINL